MSVPLAPRLATTAGPIRFVRAPGRARIGPLAAGQLVVLQLAGTAVGATYPLTDWLFVPAVLLASGAVGAAFGRRNGRWWYQDTALRWRLSRRRRAAARRASSDGSPLGWFAPDLSVREVTIRGTRYGVGLDDTGWFAACAVWPVEAPDAGRLMDMVVQLLATTRAPVSFAQAVYHGTGSPVGAHAQATQVEPIWVALRLTTFDAAAAAARRGGGTDGVHRTLAAALGTAGKAFRSAGLDYQILAAAELVTAVGAVAGWEAGTPTGADQVAGERWDAWHGLDGAHVCFRLRGSAPGPLDELIAGLGASSASSYTVSMRLEPAAAELSAHGLVQVAAPDGQLPALTSEVGRRTTRLGIATRRLDGQHARALYATAPTASPLA